MSAKRLRCAIYTRKSSDEGLEQAFNSLHAQLRAGLGLTLERAKSPRTLRARLEQSADSNMGELIVPFSLRQRGGRTWMHVPRGSVVTRKDPVLIAGLQKAHRLAAAAGWQLDGSIEHGACSAPENTYERSLVRLAFLAPELQKSVLEGRQPVTLSLEQLVRGGIPIAWSAQHAVFNTNATSAGD